MTARALAVVWLTVVWCAVMESFSAGTVVAGALVGVVLVLLFPSRPGALDRTRLHPWAFVVMNATLFAELVRANLLVAWAVIAPERAGLRRGIVAVPLVEASELTLNLLINAVSLTPGTLILEVRRDPLILYIHVLQLRSEAAVHIEVLRTHRRFVSALGPRSVLREIDQRLAALEAGTVPARPGPAVEPRTEPDPEEDP